MPEFAVEQLRTEIARLRRENMMLRGHSDALAEALSLAEAEIAQLRDRVKEANHV